MFVVLGATGPARRGAAEADVGELGGQWRVAFGSHEVVVPRGAHPVWAADWESGLSASLRAGLAAAVAVSVLPGPSTGGLPEFVAIMPVDTPDVGAAVVERVLEAARASEGGSARAVFAGRPGHPVVLRREHWARACSRAAGDSGAMEYLRSLPQVVYVGCDDLATGLDIDRPERGSDTTAHE